MTGEVASALGDVLGATRLRRHDGEWDIPASRELLDRLAADGWLRVGLREELGGSGGGLRDAAEVAAAASTGAAPLPLADTALAAVLADMAGMPFPDGARCVVPAVLDATGPDGALVGSRVPWASWASHLLAVRGREDGSGETVIVPVESVGLVEGSGPAGFPADRVSVGSRLDPVAVAQDPVRLARLLGALFRSVQIAAALQRTVDLTVAYVGTRRQFGRTLARQPVVAYELAGLAGEAAAANAASEQALVLVAADLDRDRTIGPIAAQAVAVAKVRAGLAATQGSRSAHQLHGAIGITREYELHAHSLSLWTWRDDYGAEQEWSRSLGGELAADPDGLWAAVTAIPATTAMVS